MKYDDNAKVEDIPEQWIFDVDGLKDVELDKLDTSIWDNGGKPKDAGSTDHSLQDILTATTARPTSRKHLQGH